MLMLILAICLYIFIAIRVFRHEYTQAWQTYLTHKAKIESRDFRYYSSYEIRLRLDRHERDRKYNIQIAVPISLAWLIYFLGIAIIFCAIVISRFIYRLIKPALVFSYKIIWGNPKESIEKSLIQQQETERNKKETEQYIREFDLI